MKKNKKAIMLIELSVLIICSMIFFTAVSNLMSSRNFMVSRLAENNNVIMILESISDKIRSDLKSGITAEELNLSEYAEMYNKDSYKIRLRKENDKILIMLGVCYNSSFGSVSIPKIKRIYKKEVLLNE